MKPTDKVK